MHPRVPALARPAAALALAALCAPAPARAVTENACWARAVERLDHITNPPERGDNSFFSYVTTSTSQTNVALLYPTNKRMKGFVQRLYRIKTGLHNSALVPATGCTNNFLNNLKYFMPTNAQPPAAPAALAGLYDPLKSYPDPEDDRFGYSGGWGGVDRVNPASAYRYKNFPAGGSDFGTPETPATACVNAGGLLQQAACEQCLATKGYWLNPSVALADESPAAGVFMGNWLRFNPPKWQILRLAYRRLVNGPLLSSLRDAVVGINGSQGGLCAQMMLPQSCSGTGRPIQQKQAATYDLPYSSTYNPIAEMMFNAAWYLGGGGADANTPWVFDNNGLVPLAVGNDNCGKSEPCAGCAGNFMVLFSDGRGDSANPLCRPNAWGVRPEWCTADAACSTVGMGGEGDGGDFFDAPAETAPGKTGSLINGLAVRQTPGGTCDMDWADDVARWAAENNVSADTSLTDTRLSTYVVGIGEKTNPTNELTMLMEIAKAGNGAFVVADNFSSLEAAIEYVMADIIKRSTSFSAASVTTVQSRGVTSAFVPRFRPSEGAQWSGNLLRFQLFNEFASGCTTADLGKVTPTNPNGNTSCTDYYLLDSNSDFVREDPDGNFVVMDKTQPWTADGWPFEKDLAGLNVPSAPIWDAAEALTSRMNAIIAGASTDHRRIYTVGVNANGFGPDLIPFSSSNVAAVTPLLSLGGHLSYFCGQLAVLARHEYTAESDCAADLIEFMHGRDVLWQNPYNRTTPQPPVLHARPNILGDLFHSSPVHVTGPVPAFLCSLGIVNQCTYSLFSPLLTPDGQTAYDAYYQARQYRRQLVLVGGNDGMLHAFNAANDVVDAGGKHSYDLGTGKEEWAFIPPDLLPKLQRYVGVLPTDNKHYLLVDGSPLVRDIWVDGSGSTPADGRKQAAEYHTVAIIGEREGGRNYSALDVTDPDNPRYLWTWPQPSTTIHLDAGETWNDVVPGTPPIGPVALYQEGGPLTVAGVKAKERYVLAVGGGWDPAYLRGRSINLVDAWTGQLVWRFARADSTGAGDLRENIFPVAASVAMIDVDSDGLFDSAVVGDTAGQSWVVSMQAPGRDNDGNGTVDNWYAARGFIQFKGLARSKASPFFQVPAVAALQGGDIRVFQGAGDRSQIKDPNGGTCSLVNLSACVRNGCTVDVAAQRYRIGPAPSGATGGQYVTSQWKYTAGSAGLTVNTMSVDGTPQSSVCSDVVDAALSYTIDCSGTPQVYSNLAYCDWAATTENDCPIDSGRPLNTKIADVVTTPEYSRFYSWKLFGAGARARFATGAQATAYDQAALTDSNLVDAATDVAAPTGNGWYVRHLNSVDEKVASGSMLMGGCVIWQTLSPNPDPTPDCGEMNLPPDSAYLYQADAITGAIQCGIAGSATYTATQRFTTYQTHVTPQQPSPVLSINTATNQVNYGGLTIEPGRMPLSVSVGEAEALGTIHWLEVPRRMHECRHLGQNCGQ